MSILVGCDIGGTFTDLAVWDGSRGALSALKVPTTPQDLASGVIAAVEAAGLEPRRVSHFRHGSTVAINAVLERSGAVICLVTTKGFRDVLEIGRGNRPRPFRLEAGGHPVLVDRARRLELDERMSSTGEVVTAIDEHALEEVAAEVERLEPDAVAVCLLHSYANADHERRVAECLRNGAGRTVFVSHEITGEAREFERTSTTVLHAYVGPRVHGYLEVLERRLAELGSTAPLLLIQSSGSLMHRREAERRPAVMMESGPAAGATGTAALARRLSMDHCIAFDMGGTTAKATLLENREVAFRSTYYVGGYESGLPLLMTAVDIHEVGAGGGSIAWRDPAGALHVGPRSAGSLPGPACYRRGGTAPTVTDANLALGRLWTGERMGGDVTLDRDAAVAAIEAVIARPLGLSIDRAAIGILEIADTVMAQAVRRVTIEQGRDPRGHALVAFGGAGPMHATSIARMLGIRDVVIPPDPGVFSALGMLHMPLRADRTKSALLALSDDGLHEARRIARELSAEAGAELGGDGGTVGVALDLRYRGQDHPVRVEYAGGGVADVLAAFESSYETRYGYAIPDQPVEIVKVTAWREIVQDAPPWRLDAPTAAPDSLADRQPICFGDEGGWLEGSIWWRPGCPSGTVLVGPGLVVEPTSTTVLAPGDRAAVGDIGELRILVGDA